MKKRILPILLVLVMLLSLLPAQVFAANYGFNANATIFTQNFTTETPRQNNLGDYFTVTSTQFSAEDHTTNWDTGKNGTSALVYNQDSGEYYDDTNAVLTFTFKKGCTFWFKYVFSINDKSTNSYADLRLNGQSQFKASSSNKPEGSKYSTYSLDVKKGDVFEIDFFSEKSFEMPCQMTLKSIRCTDLASEGAAVIFDGSGYQEAIPNAAIGDDGKVALPTLASAKYPAGQKYYDWYIVLADGTMGDRVTASYDFSAYRESGVTLKAQWYSRSYIIRYNARSVDSGVAGSMEDQRAPFNQKILLSPCTLTREGYTFAGWSTSSSIYGEVDYADGAELLREWDYGDYDYWGDYEEGSVDGESFDLYACWTKIMSEEEAAAREKLEAAKNLLEKTYQPSFKTDKNLLTMAQARLTAGKIEGVTVAMKAAVSTKDLFTAARAGIDLDGTLHYKWNDNGSTNSTTGRASARPIPHAIMSPAICSRSWRSSPTETAINSSAQTRTPSGPA